MKFCKRCFKKIGFFESEMEGMHYRCYQEFKDEESVIKYVTNPIDVGKKSVYCVKCGMELDLYEKFCGNCGSSTEYDKFLNINTDKLNIIRTEEISKNDFIIKEDSFRNYYEKFNLIEKNFFENNHLVNEVEKNNFFCYECGILNDSNTKICMACRNSIEEKKENLFFGDSAFIKKMFETKCVAENNKINEYNKLCKELIKIICLALINDKKSFEIIRIIENSFIYKLKIFDVFNNKLRIATSTLEIEEESYAKHIFVAIEGLKRHNYFLYYFSLYIILRGLKNFRRKFYDDYDNIRDILAIEFNIEIKEDKDVIYEFHYECANTIMPSTDMMIFHKSDYGNLSESIYANVYSEYLKKELGRCQDANKLRGFIEQLDRYISSVQYNSDIMHKDTMECAKECLVDALLFDLLINTVNWNRNFSKYLLRAIISYCMCFEDYSDTEYMEVMANKISVLLEKIFKIATFKKSCYSSYNIELCLNICEFFYNLACYFEDYPLVIANIRKFSCFIQTTLIELDGFSDARSLIVREICKVIENMSDRYVIKETEKTKKLLCKLEGNIYQSAGHIIVINDAMKKAQILDIIKKVDRIRDFVKREEINYFGSSITMESSHITRKLLAIVSEEDRIKMLLELKKYLLPIDVDKLKKSIHNEKLKKELHVEFE